MNQLILRLKNLVKKFVIWLSIFLILYLYPCNIYQILAFGSLAVVLCKVVITVLWHTLPKDFLTKLDDKAVLITGCDSGFGNKLARQLDQKGVTVYAGCLFPDGEGATDLKSSCSSRLKIVHIDVTKDDHIENIVKTVTSTLGDKVLWAVVNNAGISEIAEIEWMSLEDCQKIMDTNTFGAYRVSRAFLPLLRKSQGRIVIVGSAASRVTYPPLGVYCMSKHAVLSLADALRVELMKWNISVHVIEPFLYSTKITNEDRLINSLHQNWSKASEDMKDEYGKGYILEWQVIMSFVLNWFTRSADKVYEVIDDMEHATIGKDPKIYYVPGLIGEMTVWGAKTLPVELNDIMTYFIFCPRRVGSNL